MPHKGLPDRRARRRPVGWALLCAVVRPDLARADALPSGASPTLAEPGPLPSIRSIAIQETGALSSTISGDETAQDCARFGPTEAQLRRYFGQARRVSFRAYTHELDASRCYAAGELTLADGSAAPWRVDREGRGFVTLPRRGNLYLHCATCLGATPP